MGDRGEVNERGGWTRSPRHRGGRGGRKGGAEVEAPAQTLNTNGPRIARGNSSSHRRGQGNTAEDRRYDRDRERGGEQGGGGGWEERRSRGRGGEREMMSEGGWISPCTQDAICSTNLAYDAARKTRWRPRGTSIARPFK
eukprot:1332854-Rhodomonas_salina.1